MKKIERYLAYSGLILFVLGVPFKIMHWPGASVLMTLAVSILCLGYLPLQLIRERRETTSTLKVAYLIFRFIALFLILAAFLFKVQHWPGSGVLFILSSYLIPLLILFYLFVAYKGLAGKPLQTGNLLMLVIGFTIYFYVTRSTVSPSVMSGYMVLEQQFRKTNAGLQSANSVIYQSLETVADTGEAQVMASIRELKESSQVVGAINDSILDGFFSLFALDKEQQNTRRIGLRMLSDNELSEEYFLEEGNAHQLKLALEQYVDDVETIQARYQMPPGMIGTGFDLRNHKTPWGDTVTWEMRMFGFNPAASCITNLRWLEQVALINENVLLNQLINQFDLSDETLLIREMANSESQHAIELKENEILRINQQQELQNIQLEKTTTELNQRNTLLVLAFIGIAFVLVLLIITTRAYFRKQKDMQELEKRKEEIEGQRNEIGAQRDEIEAQRDEIEAQRDLVQEQKEQIEKTHHDISSSIDYAMRLQDAMLPGPALLEEHFSSHLIFFRPKQKVSGDFYWWTQSGNKVIIAVADCTGHGVPGAFMSLLGASLLKEIVNREGITCPGKILDRMREEVIISLNQRGSMGEQKDGMDMGLITIDTESLQCQFAGANAPLYLLRRGQMSSYHPDLMPISHYENMDPFNTTELQLETDDQLYLFSDGYADQFGGEKRKKFKYNTFRQVITEYADLSMPRQQQVLSDTIREWQGKYEQTDDMVIVGIKI